MEGFIDFVKSDTGVVIAWLCSVSGFGFGLIKMNENKALKTENAEIIAENINLKKKIVTQNGGKNVYTEKVSGGMKVDM